MNLRVVTSCDSPKALPSVDCLRASEDLEQSGQEPKQLPTVTATLLGFQPDSEDSQARPTTEGTKTDKDTPSLIITKSFLAAWY